MMVFFVTDSLWGIFDQYHLTVALYVDTSLYFISMAMTVMFWTMYAVSYLSEEGLFKRLLIGSGILITGFSVVVTIVNAFVPTLFTFDSNGVYHPLVTRYILLTLQLVLFVLTGIYALVMAYRNSGTARMKHFAIAFFGFIMGAAIVFQTLYPLLPIYAAGCIISIAVLQTFVVEKDKIEAFTSWTLVRTDALTGARSRYAYVQMEENIDKAIAKKQINNFAIVVFDINGLKEINDNQGHEAGDAYIKECFEVMRETFKGAPIYRFGGDEFVCVLKGDLYGKRDELFQKFQATIDQNRFLPNRPIVASGMAEFNEAEDNTFRAVFMRADAGMYDQKKNLKDIF